MASASSFEAVSLQNTGWFQRQFNTEAARARSRSAILDDLRTQFQPTITKKAAEVVEGMRKELLKHLDSVARKLTEVQEGRRKNKERLLDGNSDRDKEKVAILGSLKALEARQAVVDGLESIVADAAKAMV